MTRRNQRREHDHAGEGAGKANDAFPAGSLFDQQQQIDQAPATMETKPRAGLPRAQGMIPPAQGSSATSQKGAKLIEPRFGTRLRRIYDHVVAAGATGCTRQEISDELKIPIQSVCSAVARLYEMGRKSEFGSGIGSNPGHERASKQSGSPQEVLLAAKHVKRWIPEQSGAK
jgi:hypothetical protein